MDAERSSNINGRRVEEFYWCGRYVTYVDFRKVDTVFDQTIKDIQAGKEPLWMEAGN